jgi:hypothetical protein
MMTNTNATRTAGLAPVIAIATAILISLATIGVMIESPATIPTWCATHGGCP